ncbi:MAG: APC family permease [Treponemataceae bacterium]|nr:MAG: APC family permease [Treponemataceae bacterium]
MTTKKLGFGSCVFMLVGGMVGSAIFSLSGITILGAGPAAILSWFFGALIMLCYGLIVAELSAIYPKSGGIFVFPARAIGTQKQGRFWGWISTWGYFNANVTAIAFSAIYIATYLGVGFPVFAGLQVPLAFIAIIFCFCLTILQISLTGKINAIMTFVLVTTLLVFVVFAFATGKWDAALFEPFWTQGTGGKFGFVSAIPTAMVAYGAIVSAAFIVDEVHDAKKNVPASMFTAMVIVVIIYMLVIFATLGLISSEFLNDNPGMRYIPLYAAAFGALSDYPILSKIISVSAVLALLTTMLVVMILTSRTLNAASEGGAVFSFLSKKTKNGSPYAAAIVIALSSAAVASFPQFTAEIVNFGALVSVFIIVLQCVSLICARKKKQTADATAFRLPSGILIAVIMMLLLFACYIPGIISGGTKIWLYTSVWYLLGTALYFVHEKNRRHNIAE